MKNKIIVSVIVNSTLEKVWDAWTLEENVKIWNVPFSDWHCPFVENNVVTGGKFHFRMENLNGTEGFDYKGEYTQVIPYAKIINLQEDKRISTSQNIAPVFTNSSVSNRKEGSRRQLLSQSRKSIFLKQLNLIASGFNITPVNSVSS